MVSLTSNIRAFFTGQAASVTRSDTLSLRGEALTPAEMRLGRRYMIQEGSLWAFMNTLTLPAGIVTTAFALYLKADALFIGLMSALPLLAAIFQLWTPQILNRLRSRKLVCLVTLGIARILLLPLALVGLAAVLWPGQSQLWLILFLLILTVSAGFTAIGGTAWLSWATSMVPTEQRATYFSRRNTYIGVIGLGVALLTGFFLDHWSIAREDGPGFQTNPGAYPVLFLIGAVFGIATIFTLSRTPDTVMPGGTRRPAFSESLLATWKNLKLRRYLIFRTAWLFGVGIVTPYYAVYMLQNLNISFTEIFLLQNIGALSMLIATPWWGKIIEKYGCSRVLFWTSGFKSIYVVLWAFVLPGQPFLALALLHLTLAVDAGLNLCSGNLLMNLMPGQGVGNVGYFSTFTAVTSLVSAGGPFLAGSLVGLLAGNQIMAFGFGLGALQIMFLISGFLRLLSLALFRGFDDGLTATAN